MTDHDHLRVIDGGRPNRPVAYEDRVYDERAERAVLSYLRLEPEALSEVTFLRPEHFRSEAHRRIYEAMRALEARGEAIDAVSVPSELRATGRLAQVGGLPYWTELTNDAPVIGSPSHLVTHARFVRDLAVRRALHTLSVTLRARVEQDTADEAALIQDAFTELDRLSGELGQSERSDRISDVALRMMAGLDRRNGPGGIARPTGFAGLDAVIAGLHDELALVGARPGMGKTGFACAIAMHVAYAGVGVYVASLETPSETLSLRMACASAGVELHRARTGAISPEEMSLITMATAGLSALPMWVDDTASTTVAELWGKCRRIKLTLAREGKKLGLVIVDYVQLLRAARPGMKREEIVAENARALKAMASELGVTVLGLAQLNRSADGREGHRPQLSDLRESGELEQCARTVLLLYRADYYARKARDYAPTGVVEVAVAKQNNGPTGTVRVHFDERTTRFSEARNPDGQHANGCRCATCEPDVESLFPGGHEPENIKGARIQ